MTHSQVMTNYSLRVFSTKIDFWPEEQLLHEFYSEANIGTHVFFLSIDISWKYITKNEKHLCAHVDFSL